MKKKGDKYYFLSIVSQKNKRTWEGEFYTHTSIRIKI